MFNFALEPFSFAVGFVTSLLFIFLVTRARPLWDEWRSGAKEQREVAKTRKSTSIEENHRRATLRRAQGMHLAAQLFALDEILLEPLLIAPPPIVEPGVPPKFEDAVSQTIPYMPMWPEIAAVYTPQTFTVAQVMSGDSNVVVVGQPGAGKTVALAHFASQLANRVDSLAALQNMIPFLLHVGDLALPITDAKDALKPIVESASEHASLLDLGRIPAFVQHAFKSGDAILILDGFDELPPAEQEQVSAYLRLLIQTYPLARVLTSGAPEYLDGLVQLGFAPVPILTWSPMRAAECRKRWGELWAQTVAHEAWAQTGPQQVDALLHNEWLAADSLNLTPLELTLMAWGAYAGASLGPHVLEAIATHIRRIAPTNTPLAALETLAMQVILSAQPVFDPRHARDWVRRFEAAEEHTESEDDGAEEQEKAKPSRRRSKVVSTPTSGLLGRMSASGLLLSHANNKMRFIHAVFAGYLAGRAMTNFAAEDTILNQPDWAGKYLAMRYFAAHGDARKLVQAMLEFSRLPMHRPLMSAARWLRDAPRNAPWRGKLFSALATILQTEGLPLSLRGQAMAAFAVSNDPSAAALFRQFATTNAFELVQLSVLGAGVMRDAKSIEMIERALTAPSLSVRRASCMALVAIGTNDALEVAARTLLTGDEELRRAAAEAMANELHEGHAILREGISHKDILLRRAAAYGLGRIDETWAIEALQKAQVEDDQWLVRNAATEVLDARTNIAERAPHKLKSPSESTWLIEFAGKQGVGISPGAQATDILLLALKNGDVEAQLAALPYLKLTPTDGVVAQMYNAMFKDDPEVREAAYLALWEIGTSGYKLPHPSQYGLV